MTTFNVGTRFLERSRFYLGKEYPAKIRAALRAMPAERLCGVPTPVRTARETSCCISRGTSGSGS